jgi:NAD+ kinase
MIHPRLPKLMNHNTPAPMKKTNATRIRPCTNCPKPGMNKLQRAAMTFPPDPGPVLMPQIIPRSPSRRKRFSRGADEVGVAFTAGVCLTPTEFMIGLHAHAEKPAAAEVVRAMVQELDLAGLPYELDATTAPLAGKASSLDIADLAGRCELLVIMGGDGTILRAVQKMRDAIPTVFGINIGTLGFLTCLGAGEVQRAVECIRNRDYIVSPRNLMQADLVEKNGASRTFFALNDVVASRGERSQLVQIRVGLDDLPLTDYNADGLIVSTPTGSTAYSISAGGPILMPDCGCFVITPICPHVLSIRSVVMSDASVIKMQVAKPGQTVTVSVDSQSCGQLGIGDLLVLKKSPRVLPLAMLPERPFTEVIRQKLKWTGSNI